MSNNDTERLEILNESFLKPEPEVSGFQLRPFSLTSLDWCMRRKLPHFVPMDRETTPDENVFEMKAVLYMQAAPIEDVLINIWNEEKFRIAVDRFGLEVPTSKVKELESAVTEMLRPIVEAKVEVVPKPGASSNGETPPPN
jgi:hypothetical protein